MENVPIRTIGIVTAIEKALSVEFVRLKGLKNPYGDGRASDLILHNLKSLPTDEQLIFESFKEIGKF